MHKVILALGSNVGNKQENISKAVDSLHILLEDIHVANLYRSHAVGFTEQDDFINTAVRGYTNLSPQELLERIKKLEKKLGRKKRFRWGPREIDIDIIFYDDQIIQTELLELPHPRMHERDFVLQPLTDLQPQLLHPVLNKTVQTLLEELPPESHSIVEKLYS